MIFGVLPQKKNQYALRILGNCGEFTSEELLRLSELTANLAMVRLQPPAEELLN